MSFSTLCVWCMAILFVADSLRLVVTSWGALSEVGFFGNLNNIILISILFSLCLSLVLRSEVSAEGLTSFNTLGKQTFLRWQDITTVKKLNVLGLSFCLIDSKEGEQVFVCRFLSKQQEFDLLVTAITPEENPLHQCILEIGRVGS